MKVSMPMGSLCANCNMIRAVLVVPSLKQEDLTMVVVLAVLLANIVHKELSLSAKTAHPPTIKTTPLLPETHQPRDGGDSMRQTINLTN